MVPWAACFVEGGIQIQSEVKLNSDWCEINYVKLRNFRPNMADFVACDPIAQRAYSFYVSFL